MTKLGDWLLNVCYIASVTLTTTVVAGVLLIWIAALTKVCVKYLLGGM